MDTGVSFEFFFSLAYNEVSIKNGSKSPRCIRLLSCIVTNGNLFELQFVACIAAESQFL